MLTLSILLCHSHVSDRWWPRSHVWLDVSRLLSTIYKHCVSRKWQSQINVPSSAAVLLSLHIIGYLHCPGFVLNLPPLTKWKCDNSESGTFSIIWTNNANVNSREDFHLCFPLVLCWEPPVIKSYFTSASTFMQDKWNKCQHLMSLDWRKKRSTDEICHHLTLKKTCFRPHKQFNCRVEKHNPPDEKLIKWLRLWCNI